MTEVEIKAELYDLQYHNCNDEASLDQDGNWDTKPCTRYNRILELQSMLRKIYNDKNNL